MNSGKKFIFPLVFSLIFSVVSANHNILRTIPVATSVPPQTSDIMVVPGGKSIGVTLSSDGVLVVSLANIMTQDGFEDSPAKCAGLKTGDVIKSFNGKEVNDVNDLSQAIIDSGETTSPITVKRNNKTVKSTISPKVSKEDGTIKIGAWVKDAASGIGTMTFYNPETGFFAALGHGITDTETGKILPIDGGEILNSTIVSVDKSEKGAPGELKGVFSENDLSLGTITLNTDFGICGTVSENFRIDHKAVPVAKKEEIKTGPACIMANVEGNNVEKFDIEISRILPEYDTSSKNMIIKITDQKLLEKTGGIVQGMSGSPILQNGKIVGAVTHV